ncbi:MAG: tetratricopeptide repeat protein [Candidatus Hydrogenedentes bacterium]|nr:tetratricopeptide repeat protein [Candidatus Hydrogenedentota bacterium]
MNKTAIGIILALSCLLAVQTYRLHRVTEQTPSAASTAPKTQPDSTAGLSASGEAPADPTALSEDEEKARLDFYVEKLEQKDAEKTSKLTDPSGTTPSDGASDLRKLAKKAQKQLARNTASSSRTEDGDTPAVKAKKKNAEIQRLIKQAKDAMDQGDYGRAAELLNQSIETDPSNTESYRKLAKLYSTLGMTDDELQTYADWSAQRPDDASPYYQQARLLASLGRRDEALPYLDQFQQMTSGEPAAYPMAASLYRQLDMRAEEGDILQTWASSTPNSPDAHRALAQFYARTGDRAGAAGEFEALVQLTPDNARAYRDLAQAYQRLQQFEAAQNALVTAVNLQPENIQLRMQLAQAYRQNGDIDAAIQTYYDVLAAAPGSPEAVQAERVIIRIEQQAQQNAKPKRTKT